MLLDTDALPDVPSPSGQRSGARQMKRSVTGVKAASRGGLESSPRTPV